MTTDNKKAVSATAITGIEDCPCRFLEETYLRGAWSSEEHAADDRARKRGIIFHQVAEACNKARMKGLPMEEEQIKLLVLASGLDQADATDLYNGLVWDGQRMIGITPIAVEDDGGRWETEVKRIRVQGKYDIAYLNDQNGRLTVKDYKSRFVPSKEVMYRAIQPRMYAWSGQRTYHTPGVDVVVASLGQRFSYTLEYSEAALAEFKPFLEDRIAKCAEVILMAEAEPDKAKLKDAEEFKPKLNGWCPNCPIRKRCVSYRALVWFTPEPVEGSRPAAVEALRVRAKLIGVEKDRAEEDLKADARSASGSMESKALEVYEATVAQAEDVFRASTAEAKKERDRIKRAAVKAYKAAVPEEAESEGLHEDGYTVKLVSRVDEIEAKPATERIVTTLVVMKDGAVAEPKAERKKQEGKK